MESADPSQWPANNVAVSGARQQAGTSPVQASVRTANTRSDKPLDVSQIVGQILNTLDFGVLVVDRDSRLITANELADRTFSEQLQIDRGATRVTPIDPAQRSAWTTALVSASTGNEQYLNLCQASPFMPMSLQAIDIGAPLGNGLAIMVSGERVHCVAPPLALDAYADAAGLTRTETQTLRLLGDGQAPADIAGVRGVSEYTVRAQVKNIYRRTETNSARNLLITLSKLPPTRHQR